MYLLAMEAIAVDPKTTLNTINSVINSKIPMGGGEVISGQTRSDTINKDNTRTTRSPNHLLEEKGRNDLPNIKTKIA